MTLACSATAAARRSIICRPEARERFRAGVAGDADVITASLDLNGARTLEVDALANYQAARVALALATGSVTELP